MRKQVVAVVAAGVMAIGLSVAARAQSGLAGLSPQAQAEIQNLSPAQRAALAHSLLGDSASAPVAMNAPTASSSIVQNGNVSTVAAAPAGMASAAPGYRWAGCYVAAGAGVGMLNDDHATEAGSPPNPIVASTTAGGNGVLGRLGLGCDWQVASRFIVGAFGDADITSISGDYNAALSGVAKENMPYNWAVGARGGYLLLPQLLGFLDAGFAQAHFHYDGIALGLPSRPSSPFSIPDYDANGVFGGAGFEMALDSFPGTFWRNEYRYAYYFGTLHPFDGAGIVAFERSQPAVQTVTTSLVYRFGVPGVSN